MERARAQASYQRSVRWKQHWDAYDGRRRLRLELAAAAFAEQEKGLRDTPTMQQLAALTAEIEAQDTGPASSYAHQLEEEPHAALV